MFCGWLGFSSLFIKMGRPWELWAGTQFASSRRSAERHGHLLVSETGEAKLNVCYHWACVPLSFGLAQQFAQPAGQPFWWNHLAEKQLVRGGGAAAVFQVDCSPQGLLERVCKWGQPCGGEQAAGGEDYTERLCNVFAKCLTTVPCKRWGETRWRCDELPG